MAQNAAGFAAADANNFFSPPHLNAGGSLLKANISLRTERGCGHTCVTVIVFGGRSLIYATLCRSNWRDVKASGGGGGRVGPTPLLAGGSGYHTHKESDVTSDSITFPPLSLFYFLFPYVFFIGELRSEWPMFRLRRTKKRRTAKIKSRPVLYQTITGGGRDRKRQISFWNKGGGF